MGKKKGAVAAKARAKREARHRDTSPSPGCPAAAAQGGPVVPDDGKRVHRGLANLGNTCFLNSIIQCLNVSLPFSDELIELSAEGLDGLSGSLCSVFREIRGVGDHQGSGAFSPKPLLEQLVSRFPWYKGKCQQDAHEFLRTIIGSISDETTVAERSAEPAEDEGGAGGARKPPAPGDPTDNECWRCVNRSFRGHLCAAMLCWGCKRISLRLDAFLDLQLDLPAVGGTDVGALGVLPVEEDARAAEAGDDAEGTKDGQPKKKKAAKGSGGSAGSRAPRKGKPSAAGVWGEAQKTAESRQASHALLLEVILRVLVKQGDLSEEDAAEAAAAAADAAAPVDDLADMPTVEIELSRPITKKTPKAWGFVFSDAKLEEGILVVHSTAEDSILDKYNLKCRARGDEEEAVYIGDRLVEVNGEREKEQMMERLKCDNKVTLVFVRSQEKRESLGGGVEERSRIQEEKASAAAAREEARQAYCEAAKSCQESLPEALAEIFGPCKTGRARDAQYGLEDCLRNFSVVESLEDDYKPTYWCRECGKEGGCKTFASRRMWLWPADLPPLLTLQFKRFRRYGQRFEKSSASIALPLQLDVGGSVLTGSQLESLRAHVLDGSSLHDSIKQAGGEAGGGGGAQPLLYRLRGVCVHEGSSMQSGHYVAYVNAGPSPEQEEWCGISDAKIWKCDLAEVLKSEAYVAFYQRVDVGGPGNSNPADPE